MAFPVMLAVALASSVYSYADAKNKERVAEAEADMVPKETMPESAVRAEAEGSNLAKGRSAGADRAERALAESAATMVARSERGASSSAQIQEAAATAQGMESKGIRKIREQEEAETVKRKGMYIDQLWKMADLEKGIDDSNKSNEWNVEQGIKGAAQVQKSNAINNVASTAMMGMMMGGGSLGGASAKTTIDTNAPNAVTTVDDIPDNFNNPDDFNEITV